MSSETIKCPVCETKANKPTKDKDTSCLTCGTRFSKGYQKIFWKNDAGQIVGVIKDV